MVSNIRRLTRSEQRARESGQALVEYALILLLLALVAFGALEAIGTSVSGALFDVAAGFPGG